MNNIRTIIRRDLGAFFTSPIGYIFIIVFLIISVGLYITSFFTFPVADMRSYFGNLPLLMCVFIPAVTMRVWAEERKENTWEMLLTFPMRAWELVIGKFLATFIFFTITVACTVTVPLMLMWLGNPDNGAIVGGYAGTLLLGAFFIAIGIFVSGFCRDQIVAFVVSLLACFAIFLLGTSFIASYIDGFVPGLGSTLSTLIGMVEHYQTFTRGVIEVVDIAYFLIWTVLFLVLNIMFIEQRNRPGSRVGYAVAIAISMGVGLLFNFLVTDLSLGRWDLTEDKAYTVSPATRAILSNLESPAQIKVYISPKEEMPTALKTLEQDITDKLAELRIAAGGKLEFTPVYLRAANVLLSQEDLLSEEEDEAGETEESESEKLEKLMLSRGVEPFMAQALVNDEVSQKPVYSSIGIGYLDAKEEIIPQVVPERLAELEYRLVNTIYKLSRKDPPRVALVAPKEAVNIPPQLRQLYAQMGQPVPETEDPYEYLQMVLEAEKYQVDRVDLTQQSPLPEEFSTLVVVNPRELNERQKWEINRALVSGKNVVLAVQNYEWDYRVTPQGEVNLTKREQNPQVNDLLASYGLGVSTDILMDVNQVPLTVRSSNNPLEALMGGTTLKLPMHMLINNSTMDPTAPITNRLSSIFYLWGSHLDLKSEELANHKLESKVVMSTTDGAWTVPADKKLSDADIRTPSQGQAYPLMAVISGQFPDAFKDKPRPVWPPAQPMPGMPPEPVEPEDAEVPPVTPAPGKLVLLGCSQMFNKNFLQQANLDLFLNTVDTVTLGEDIVSVRGKKPIDRVIDKPTDREKSFWRFINFAAVNGVIAGIGTVSALARRQSRNAYTASYQSQQNA